MEAPVVIYVFSLAIDDLVVVVSNIYDLVLGSTIYGLLLGLTIYDLGWSHHDTLLRTLCVLHANRAPRALEVRVRHNFENENLRTHDRN